MQSQLVTNVGSLTSQHSALVKLRSHFQKDVRRQLYGDEDDQQFFRWINGERKQVEKRLEDGRAVGAYTLLWKAIQFFAVFTNHVTICL